MSTDAKENPTPIAIAVVEHQGRFLIGLRPEGAPLAGYWEFPGGKIHPGETPQAAAARECREETGLDVQVDGEYPETLHTYAHGQLWLRFFACRPVNSEAPIAARFRWVARGELASYRFPDANAALLALLASEGAPHSETHASTR